MTWVADAMDWFTLPLSKSCAKEAKVLVKSFTKLVACIADAMNCLTLPFLKILHHTSKRPHDMLR